MSRWIIAALRPRIVLTSGIVLLTVGVTVLLLPTQKQQ